MPTTNRRSSARTRKERSGRSASTRSSSGKQKRYPANRSSKAETGTENATSQLEKLFTDSLKDLYWAEKHLTKALPKMKKKATTDELKSAIEEHLAQTEEHISRLEQVFSLCGKKAQAKKCDAMDGLVKEGESVIEETEDNSMTRDAGIIMAAQKVEHYEIATYGSLVQFAKTLGMDDVAEILHRTLDEEKYADEKLTEIAEWHVNKEAQQEEGAREDDEEETEDESESEAEEVEQGEEN
ncbi:MAG TPA: ferritin-like domain-containing protein [Chitinophagaceae bacterium]